MIRRGATLEPVRVGRVLVREWLYNQETASNGDMWALGLINYRERVLTKGRHSDEWLIANGNRAEAKAFRRMRAILR